MNNPGIETEIISSLRKIIRAVDIFSKKLKDNYGLNSSQISCLMQLSNQQPISISQLSKSVLLSPSMLTIITDQLESKGYVRRNRKSNDRRVIFIELTENGKEVIKNAPTSLQQKLTDGLKKLSEGEKEEIYRSLTKLIHMIQVEDLTAVPILGSGEKFIGEKTSDIFSDDEFSQGDNEKD